MMICNSLCDTFQMLSIGKCQFGGLTNRKHWRQPGLHFQENTFNFRTEWFYIFILLWKQSTLQQVFEKVYFKVIFFVVFQFFETVFLWK